MPVLTRTRTIRARSMQPGMRVTRHIRVSDGIYKPAEPLRVTEVHQFPDRRGNPIVLLVFAGCDLWPLPWCYDFRPGSPVEVVTSPSGEVTR